jgi:hypothetical protein
VQGHEPSEVGDIGGGGEWRGIAGRQAAISHSYRPAATKLEVGMSTFWDKVAKCKHENLTDHDAMISCGTPYCDYGYEYNCRDCGVFISDCACGFCNGMSGWSNARYRRWYGRKGIR